MRLAGEWRAPILAGLCAGLTAPPVAFRQRRPAGQPNPEDTTHGRPHRPPPPPPRGCRAFKHWVALGAPGALSAGFSGGSDVAQTSRTATEHPEGSEPTPRPEPGTAVALAWSKTLAHWPGTVTVSGSQVIVADGQGVISTYGVDDGTRGWEVRLDELTGEVLPAIDDHTVLLSAVDQFIALQRTTGATPWSVPTDPAPAAGAG